MVRLGSEGPRDPFDQDQMYRWDRLPTSVVLDLRAANERAQTSERPYDFDWSAWSDGDDRSPRGIARCLEKWVVDTGRTADSNAKAPMLDERPVFGPNNDAVLSFLDSAPNARRCPARLSEVGAPGGTGARAAVAYRCASVGKRSHVRAGTTAGVDAPVVGGYVPHGRPRSRHP